MFTKRPGIVWVSGATMYPKETDKFTFSIAYSDFARSALVVQNLEVLDEECRNEGLGYKIVKAIIAAGEAVEASCLLVCIDTNNEAAIRLAKKAGFVEYDQLFSDWSMCPMKLFAYKYQTAGTVEEVECLPT
jgi:RimJ/RimL family protein N-acetyltransferase